MVIAFVLRAQNFADFRLVLGEVVERDEATEARHVVYQSASGFAAIKLGGAVLGNPLECGGELRLTKRIPRLKHLAVVQENSAADGETLETGALLCEFMGEPLADGKAIFSKANGRGDDIGELHGAIGFQGESEAGDRARHGHRAIADDGGLFIELAGFSDVHVPGGLSWRHLTVIEKRGLAIR